MTQTNNRPSSPPRRHKTRFFGQFLLAEGYITAPQLLAALEYQEQFNARLGEYAVALGLLTLFDAQRIHALQVEKDLLFGQAALELSLLTKEQLRQVMAAQRNDHVLLGEALCKLGYVDEATIKRALTELGDTTNQIDPDQWLNIGADVPAREWVTKTCYLTHKLLQRLWDLPNKASEAQAIEDVLRLSDRNVTLSLRGDHTLQVYLGVPHAAAQRAVRVILGNPSPTDGECDDATRDLLTAIAQNLKVTMASEGIAVSVGDVERCDFNIAATDKVTLLVPFLTHEGQVIVGVRC